MKIFSLVAAMVFGFSHAQAEDGLSLYTDMSLSCDSKEVFFKASKTQAKQSDKNIWMTVDVQNKDFSDAVKTGSEGLGLNVERESTLTDAFGFAYTFSLTLEGLESGESFDLEVVKTHEIAGTSENLKVSCVYKYKAEFLEFKEATKNNLKKLSEDQFIHVLTLAADAEPEMDSIDLDISDNDYAQLKYYARNMTFKNEGLRSSYTKYVKSLNKKYSYLYDDCREQFLDVDLSDDEFRDAEDAADFYAGEHCYENVGVILDADGAFVAGAVNFIDGNGTDDSDDDTMTVILLDWRKNILDEREWSN